MIIQAIFETLSFQVQKKLKNKWMQEEVDESCDPQALAVGLRVFYYQSPDKESNWY